MSESRDSRSPNGDLQCVRPPYDLLGLNRTRRHIRVLVLKPGFHDAKLKGALRVVSLSQKPRYEALSYTWGRSTNGEVIQLNRGHCVSITDNLSKALRWLRSPFLLRILWVDAICVNQDDLDERSQQVALMGDIYHNAFRGLVWLGEYQGATRLHPFWMIPGYEKDRFVNSSRSRKFAAALDDALQATQPRWTDRAWIIQEYLLSRKIAFCLGPYLIKDSARDEFVPRSFPHYSSASMNGEIEARLPSVLPFTVKIEAMRQFKSTKESSRPNLVKAILLTNGAECQDPRDRIYSLLNLMNPEEADFVMQDYHGTYAQAFAQATFASIIVQKGFEILALIRPQSSDTERDLPSWVPDFTVDFPHLFAIYMDHFHRLFSSRQYWRAIGRQDAPALSADAKTLTTRGGKSAASPVVSEWVRIR